MGSSPVARHYWGNHCLFSLPGGTKMFQFPPFASDISRIPCLQHGGLSHSEITGSRVICTSPVLIAAYHVLHRLCEPRHPPCALFYFLAQKTWSNILSAFILRFAYFTFDFIVRFRSNMSKISSGVWILSTVNSQLTMSSRMGVHRNSNAVPK